MHPGRSVGSGAVTQPRSQSGARRDSGDLSLGHMSLGQCHHYYFIARTQAAGPGYLGAAKAPYPYSSVRKSVGQGGLQ
eukprot:745708-Hanusia_phi.AAC.9